MDGEFSYVAICAHGKIRAAAVDCDSMKPDLPKYLREFAKWAHHIDRVSTESVRSGEWKCTPCDDSRKSRRSRRKP